jgi:YqxM protein
MRRFVAVFLLLVTILTAAAASAALLDVSGGVLQVMEYTVSIPTLTATLTPTETSTPTITPVVWDKSSLEFVSEGWTCDGGGRFWAVIQNVGEAMQGPSFWEVYLAGSLLRSGEVPALDAKEEWLLSLSVSSAGKYRFKTYQRTGHPGSGDLWSGEIRFDPLYCANLYSRSTPVPSSTLTSTPTTTLIILPTPQPTEEPTAALTPCPTEPADVETPLPEEPTAVPSATSPTETEAPEPPQPTDTGIPPPTATESLPPADTSTPEPVETP